VTRLQQFREYMAKMNPVQHPMDAIQGKLYVHPPGRSIAEALASRLELEPTSSHLVAGGIGAGKTTEILTALGYLLQHQTGDATYYLDVAQYHRFEHQVAGVLVAVAGHALRDASGKTPRSKAVDAARASLRRHAEGFVEWVEPGPDPDDTYEGPDEEPEPMYRVTHPGVLDPPMAPISEKIRKLIPDLQVLKQAIISPGAHLVVAFDSLDRVLSPPRFSEAVRDDVRVLKAAGFGVVVVGPIRLALGSDRSVLELFDNQHFVLPTNTTTPEGRAFLTQVLFTRAGASLIDADAIPELVTSSGGVLRDLISLAKTAGEEAYVAGHATVTVADTRKAIDAFGRSLALGLDDAAVTTLRHLRESRGFVIRGELEISLVESRRVLMYGGSQWAVHPSLVPLLDAIATHEVKAS
jgi:hypothetical protein